MNCCAEAKEIVASIGASDEYTIPLLQEIQRRHTYLPQDLVEALSRETGIPLSTLFGVATFYAQFRFKPQGKHLIRVCKGTACHVAGSEKAATLIAEELGIAEGETTADGLFSFEQVACLGCCSLAPVAMADGKIHANLTGGKINSMIKEHQNGTN